MFFNQRIIKPFSFNFGPFGSIGGAVPPPNNLLSWLYQGSEDGLVANDVYEILEDFEYKQANALSFDGATAVVDSGVTIDITLPFVATAYFNTSVGEVGYIMYQGQAGDVSQRDFVILCNTALKVMVGVGVEYNIGGANEFFDDKWHCIEIISNGTTFDTVVDGQNMGTNPVGLNAATRYTVSIGARNNLAPTAYTTFFDGMLYGISVSTAFNYNLAEGSGLPYDVSGNGNHATINTATWARADGIEATNLLNGFYVATQGVPPYIPALTDGSGLAANGELLTNKAGVPHNGCEVELLATSPSVVRKITVSDLTGVDAVDNGDYYFTHIEATKAHYENDSSAYMVWNTYSASKWSLVLENYVDSHPTSTAQFPESTGWPVGAGGTAPTLTYDNTWVDTNGDFKNATFEELIALTEDTDTVRTSLDSSSRIYDICTYVEPLEGDELTALNALLDSRSII